jgi:uncharacterized protein YegJ (DUF2314 family)
VTTRIAITTIVLGAAVLAGGCEVESETPERTAVAPVTAPKPAPSAWRTIDESPQVAVPADAPDAALASARERARASMDDARTRWAAATEDERRSWAIKWAAPTVGGGVEYVWVEPLTWSTHRIEGRLASPPQHELTCGRTKDELVGFPAEELADWVHYLEGDPTGPREGGFTVDVLERRFGRVGS